MLNYKQRYKPRTEREYTKTDLTVYDSAGNTALNALMVYGKSEVVEGEIVSAGDSGSITITSNNNITNLITSIIQGTVDSSGSLLPTNTRRVMTTPIYIEPSTEIFLNSNSNARVYEVNEWDENDNYLGYYGINSTSGSRIVGERTHKIIVTFKYSNDADITPEVVANATITLSPNYITMATFTTGTPLYGVSETVRDAMVWNGSAGTVTKNCDEVDLGTLEWQNTGSTFYTTLPTRKDNVSRMLCSKYMYVANYGYTVPDKKISDSSSSNHKKTIFICDNDYTDSTAFKAAMSGVKLIYELATPTTALLTQTENESLAGLRTFDGTTHFTNNATTDMTVNYTIKVPTIS